MKKILLPLFLLSISALSYSAPKASYKTGVAYALNDFFTGPSKKVVEVNEIIQLEENIYAQKVKYQTYNDFGGQIFKEKVFIIKKIGSSYKFMEKLDIDDINL